LLNHDKGRTYKIIFNTLKKELDYKVDARLLDAANFSVPQHRKRIYLVGFSKAISTHKDFSFQ